MQTTEQQFIVVDRNTGLAICKPTTARKARALRDRKDSAYGGYRFAVQTVSGKGTF